MNPDENELVSAARWACTHDVSEGFAIILKDLLCQLGFENAASRI